MLIAEICEELPFVCRAEKNVSTLTAYKKHITSIFVSNFDWKKKDTSFILEILSKQRNIVGKITLIKA